MSIVQIPALRFGEAYHSLDLNDITDCRTGEVLAQTSVVNAGLIRRDLKKAKQAYDALGKKTVAELVEISRKAGELFMTGTLPLGDVTQTPEQFIENLSATSGLPQIMVRQNMEKINYVLSNTDTVLAGLSRGLDLSVLDKGIVEQDGMAYSYFPNSHSLGVILPSNSPGVNSLWLPSLTLKVPVVMKPGREEPWTPFRLMQAFIAAGCPKEAFCFYPTSHEGSGAILELTGRSILFGDAKTVQKYAGDESVSIHGPGFSKVLIGEDQIDDYEAYLDVLVASVARGGGRSCINASMIVVPRKGRELAEALAKKLAEIQPKALDDEAAALSAFANPAVAEAINARIEDELASSAVEDITAQYRNGERLVQLNGSTFLQPTLCYSTNIDAPLARAEYLFPYACVVELPQEQMLEKIGPSLVVSAITEDRDFIDAMLASSDIPRLNIGRVPTAFVEWNQPHEGNLFEFLYRRRAIHVSRGETAA
ncbi:MAG: acyl-CoA reductase-like NAD-dependent aldehyde dehydrogenase [Kiritimatiellia bacterium]|jgi:acyl-CoA reductase-like NAD-dependent aldehyde dehydrogenase